MKPAWLCLALSPIVLLAARRSLALAVAINEVDADQGAFDDREFIELFDFGQGNRPLDGFFVVLYDGASDLSYATYDLTGESTDAQGFFMIGTADVANVDRVIGDADVLVDGSGAVGLYFGDPAAFPPGTPPTAAGLLDSLVYSTSFFWSSPDPGLAVLLTSGQQQKNENAHGNGEAHSNGRCPDGAGGQMDTRGYSQGVPTPGMPSSCFPTPTFCDDSDGALSFCPCANPGAPDTGCDRPIPSMQGGGTTGGVRLNLVSQVRGAQNQAVLTGTGHNVGGPSAAVLLRGRTLEDNPAAFGDGLRCVASPVVRIGAATGFFGPVTHTIGHGSMAGQGVFYYQEWFRLTPTSFCNPSASFGLSSGKVLTW